MIVEKKLSNGLRVICERLPHFRSVAVGVWVAAGSVKETGAHSGISHYIEHMLFKGTQRRSAKDIAVEMDALGGQMNAFTSKECTCFYTKVMDAHLDKACDILADIVLGSVLDPAEMEKEKGVVLEEILMVEDTPDDLVHDVLTETFYHGHPLGAPILGTKESVSAFSQADLQAYMAQQYTAGNMLIAVAGNFDEAQLMDVLEEKFAKAPQGSATAGIEKPTYLGKRAAVREKDIEQLNIALMLPGYAMAQEEYYTMVVLNNVLGGSMSSRLFQKIREERGLAYAVYSFTASYSNSGSLGLYAGTGAAQGEQVLQLMVEELRAMQKDGISQAEFERSKEQIKGNYVLGSESTSTRMSSIGKSKLIYGRAMSEEQVFERIESVTFEDTRKLAQTLFDTDKLCAAFVGRSDKSADEWSELW